MQDFENNETMNKELQTLETMNSLAETPDKSVQDAKLSENTIEDLSRSLANFTKDSFALIKQDFSFREELKDEFRKRIQLDPKDGGITSRDFLGFFNSESVNMNDRLSKVLGPTFQLMTSEQQAVYAAKQAELKAAGTNIQINTGAANQAQMRSINESAEVDQKTLQGLTQLNNMIQMMVDAANKKNAESEEVKNDS